MNQLVLVIGMALLVVAGLGLLVGASSSIPSEDGPPASAGNGLPAPGAGPVQDVFLRATSSGTYDPSRLSVRVGVPVRLHFSADSGAGCGHSLVIPEFNVWDSAPSSGEKVISFTPKRKGVFDFHCSMKMFRGKLEVVD